VGRKRLAVLVASIALLGLAWLAAPAVGALQLSASVSAQLKERRGADRWRVEIRWSASCSGVMGGKKPVYNGDLYMVDVDTGARHYVGGVADTSGRGSVSGTREWDVSALRREQHLMPAFTINCYEQFPQSGGPTITVTGNTITIPPAFGGGSGGGGGFGGPGGDYGTGDPTEPLRSGGCGAVIQGTNSADRLTGGNAGDVIFGFGAGDRIRGRRGHDCLIGGRGNDLIRGESGWDKLIGGRGRDRLYGGSGRNFYDAGPGNDYVNARNRRRERVRCGRGRDRARVDRRDRVRSCERVSRARR
jgi:RTX calcium-binding nonapeptide repeat (4 copies)